jgi:hypothetical protein
MKSGRLKGYGVAYNNLGLLRPFSNHSTMVPEELWHSRITHLVTPFFITLLKHGASPWKPIQVSWCSRVSVTLGIRMHIRNFYLHRRRTSIAKIRRPWQRHAPHILRGDKPPTAFPKSTSLYRATLPPMLLPASYEVGEMAILAIQIWRRVAKGIHFACVRNMNRTPCS